MLTGANARVKAKLEKAGIIALVSQDNLFDSLSEALAACRQLADTDPAMHKGRITVISESAEAPLPANPDNVR
jgi:SulP family sulfate permease